MIYCIQENTFFNNISSNKTRLELLCDKIEHLSKDRNKPIPHRGLIFDSITSALANNYISIKILPFDCDINSTLSFIERLRTNLSNISVINYSSIDLLLLIANTFGFYSLESYVFQLFFYQNILNEERSFNGSKLRRLIIDNNIIGFPGYRTSRYSQHSYIPYHLSNNENLYYLGELHNGGRLLKSTRRYWGISKEDIIAWKSSEILWELGPLAWNTYLGIARSSKTKDELVTRYLYAEQNTYKWRKSKIKYVQDNLIKPLFV